MKKLIVAFIMAFSMDFTNSKDDFKSIIVNYMILPQMEYARELIPNNPIVDHQIILDCQSFFNGIHYKIYKKGKWQDDWFIMLAGKDCEDSMDFSDESITNLKPYCLIVNHQTKEVDFNSDVSLCF